MAQSGPDFGHPWANHIPGQGIPDKPPTKQPSVAVYPYLWAVEYLKDARDNDAIERDTPDEIIEREAHKLETAIFQLASSFVDNDFEESK